MTDEDGSPPVANTGMMVTCLACGTEIPAGAHVCLKCGTWTRTGPLGLYVNGVLKALGAIATGVALPVVLLVATKRFEDRTAQNSRADRVQQEQADIVSKAAGDAHEATLLSIEVFEIRSRVRAACEEYAATSAIAHEPWMGPGCATLYLQAISALDVAISKLAYRVDELPVNRGTIEDMRKLSKAYWGVPGGTSNIRQELVSVLHSPSKGVEGIGLKYCGPMINESANRRDKCGVQLHALQGIIDRLGQVTNVVFCGLSHDLAEFRAQVYEISSSNNARVSESPQPNSTELTVPLLLAKRLRENAGSNVCSWALWR